MDDAGRTAADETESPYLVGIHADRRRRFRDLAELLTEIERCCERRLAADDED